MLRRGQREEARRICLVVLENKKLEDTDIVHGFNILGMSNFETDPLSAEKSFQKALELAQTEDNLRLQIIVHNNLGRLLRSMSRLDASIEHFNKALELARRSGNLEHP